MPVFRPLLVVALAVAACSASAQIAVIALENKVVLNNGVSTVVASPKSDGAAILDLGVTPPRLLAQIDLPAATVLGPPTTVALTPTSSLALVAGGQSHDPADRSKLVNHNLVSVIDLAGTAPRFIGSVQVGAQATGIAVAPNGKLALVANRGEGTVSILSINGNLVTATGKLTLGKPDSGPSGIVFTPDGAAALVTRDGDNTVTVLKVTADKVEAAGRDIAVGTRPYGITMSGHGRWAAVANIGRGGGDADTVSLIDLTKSPYRTGETFTVGQTPEGVMASPDGQHLAVVVMNGSNKPRQNPFYADHGFLQIWRIASATERPIKVAEAAIGHWSQGAIFSHDGKTVMVMNMVENDLQGFSFDGSSLRETSRIKLNGGAAAGRVAGVN
ncbi:MAG: hypothetical protein RLZZ126_150 [Pseudomonadota bacterium]